MIVTFTKAELAEIARADAEHGQFVCDKNCFQCKFADCIYDGMEYDDYLQSAALDKELIQTADQKKVAAYKRAYREANKEKVAAYQRAYYEANKEKAAAYREKNRDKIREKNRKRYELNKESLAAARYAKKDTAPQQAAKN